MRRLSGLLTVLLQSVRRLRFLITVQIHTAAPPASCAELHEIALDQLVMVLAAALEPHLGCVAAFIANLLVAALADVLSRVATGVRKWRRSRRR